MLQILGGQLVKLTLFVQALTVDGLKRGIILRKIKIKFLEACQENRL
jgi:hypothetical protein